MTKKKLTSDKVIDDFGSEWARFNYVSPTSQEMVEQFERYLSPVPQDFFTSRPIVAADYGAGSGRWSQLLESRVTKLYVVEPSKHVASVLNEKFVDHQKVEVITSKIEDIEIPDSTLDFAMSLGVLHHVEDTQGLMMRIFRTLKPGGLFLGYLYYDLSNKPWIYRVIWKLSNWMRNSISKLPKPLKVTVCELLAIFIYWPLSKFSLLISKFGISNENMPLHQYSKQSLYIMRNDALDRFGTRLEKRYSQDEIRELLIKAGADSGSIYFSNIEPFWTFTAKKSQ